MSLWYFRHSTFCRRSRLTCGRILCKGCPHCCRSKSTLPPSLTTSRCGRFLRPCVGQASCKISSAPAPSARGGRTTHPRGSPCCQRRRDAGPPCGSRSRAAASNVDGTSVMRSIMGQSLRELFPADACARQRASASVETAGAIRPLIGEAGMSCDSKVWKRW